MLPRPFELLLVEDTPGDIWLTREILQEGTVPKNISVVNDGEQALDFLYRRGKFAGAPRPDLVLLDLNLPRITGLEVLAEIKNDSALRTITVIVLTTSEAARDVNAAYDLNANCYIVKPVDLETFTGAVRGIEQFWMATAVLPTTLPSPEAAVDQIRVSTQGSGDQNGSQSAKAAACARSSGYPDRHAIRSVGSGTRVPRSSPRSGRGRGSSSTRHRYR